MAQTPITLEEALGIHGATITPEPKTPQISPPTPKQLAMETRRDQVIALILKRTDITEIAKQLGVDRKTIYTDFEEWAKTDQATHLQIEWMNQYEMMKVVNPEEAFQALTRLVMKLVEKQAKLEVNLTQNNLIQTEVNINTDGLSEAEQNAVISAGRILIKKSRSQTESNSLH